MYLDIISQVYYVIVHVYNQLPTMHSWTPQDEPIYVASVLEHAQYLIDLLNLYVKPRGPSKVDLAYVVWKQADFALDLWFENLICDLKTWFGI